MSLTATERLSGQEMARIANEKRFTRTVDSQAANGTEEKDSLLRVKFNPDWEQGLTPGTPAAAATVEVDATNIILRVDSVIERNVAFAGKDVQTLIDEINAPNADGSRYWRAGQGDAFEVLTTGLAVLAETDAMLGYLDSVPLSHASAAFLYAGINVDESERGVGGELPQGLDTDYSYDIQTSPGNPSSAVGRGGGIAADQGEDILPQKASLFHTSNFRVAKERHPANVKFVTRATSLSHNLTTAGAENLVFSFYTDDDSNVPVVVEVPETQLYVELPDLEIAGPMHVSVNGKAFGDFTGGKFTVRGLTRLM